jgi:hypothetical protein
MGLLLEARHLAAAAMTCGIRFTWCPSLDCCEASQVVQGYPAGRLAENHFGVHSQTRDQCGCLQVIVRR